VTSNPCVSPESKEISAAFSAPCLLMKGTFMEYLSAELMLENQKPLSKECFKKPGPYHSISVRVI